MNNNEFVNLIKHMGHSYEDLVSKKILYGTSLENLYQSDETLEVQLSPDIELVFWTETKRFEMIILKYEKSSSHRAILPTPLNNVMNQSDAQFELGEPLYSKTQIELYQTDIYGWDTYQLDSNLHPEAILDIQYNKDMQISSILISLMDKNL